MNSSGGDSTSQGLAGESAGWRIEPFLHDTGSGYYNPLTDRTIRPGDRDFDLLRRMRDGAGRPADLSEDERQRLAASGWLASGTGDFAARFRLLYVTLETHSVCNQSCDFCPVAGAPRPVRWMSDALFDSIVDQLAAYRDTLRAVFLSHYNEPTLDPRLPERVAALARHGIPVALNTNGTNLTPAVSDALAAVGGLAYLSVNLSTLDPVRYAKERGSALLSRVLRNLDHAASRPVAERMEIAVLSDDPGEHDRAVAGIARRFAGTRFVVRRFALCDRAGRVGRGVGAADAAGRLAGCEQTGSRPLQHLHIVASGRCVLCCQDYEERYVCGDLTMSSVADVLGGETFRRLRKWVYGLEEAPADFICRRCAYALTVPSDGN